MSGYKKPNLAELAAKKQSGGGAKPIPRPASPVAYKPVSTTRKPNLAELSKGRNVLPYSPRRVPFGTREATLKDLTIGSFKRGFDQSDYGVELYKQMSGKDNKAAEYQHKMESDEYNFQPKNLFGRAVSGAAELLGQQVNQWTDPTSVAMGVGAAGVASLAGKAGPQVVIPEEILTVPAAFTAGLQAGSAKRNFEIEAGHAYKEMLDNGVSPKTASTMASLVGGGNAALELIQMDELVKGLKVLSKTGADDTVLKRIGKEIASRTADVAKETAQEVAQEGVTMGGVHLATKKDLGKGVFTGADVKDRLADTALSSALSFGAMNIPGGVRNVIARPAQQATQSAPVDVSEPTAPVDTPVMESAPVAPVAPAEPVTPVTPVTAPAKTPAAIVAEKVESGKMPTNNEIKAMNVSDPTVREELSKVGIELPPGVPALGSVKERIRAAVSSHAEPVAETDVPETNVENITEEKPTNGPTWKQKFLDESFFTNLATPRADERMVRDEIDHFADNAANSYQPGDTYGNFADYSWDIERHKWGPYYELTLHNRITGETTRISGDTSRRSIRSELSRAIYEDASKMLGEVRKPVESAPAVAENATTTPAPETVEDSSATSAENAPVDAAPSIGAADKGFDDGFAEFQGEARSFHPINQNSAERVVEEQGRAPEEVPKANPRTGKHIRKLTSTIINSPLTPDVVAQMFEDGTIEGKFDYAPISDSAATARARQEIAEAGGYRNAANTFLEMVDSGKRINKYDSTKAVVIYNDAVQNGDNATAFLVGEALDTLTTEGGAVIQSMNLFNRLGPAGQLLRLKRFTERANKDLAGKGNVDPDTQAAIREIVKQIKQERDSYADMVQQMINAYAEANGQPSETLDDVMAAAAAGRIKPGEADAKISSDQEEGSWIAQLGKDLAKAVERKVKPENVRERTVYELISSDLSKFLDSYLIRPPKNVMKPRTAANRIADYFQNKAAYEEAWSKAQERIRDKYSKNPEMLAKVDDWLYSTLGYQETGSDAVLLRAVADMAVADKVKAKGLIIRGEYDADAFANQLADQLIREAGVNSKGDAAIIRDAAQRYVERAAADEAWKRTDAARKSGKDIRYGGKAQSYFDADISNKMREIGVKMSDIITRGAKDKASLAAHISSMLSDDYGLSPDGAQAIANDIVSEFNRKVETAARNRLESIFKSRPKRVQKSVEKKFTELGNLGAFTDPSFNSKAAEKIFGVEGIQIDKKLADAYLNAETDEARAEAWENLLDDLAEKMPVTVMDRVNAARYTNMLGNFKTQVRNVSGNVGMMGVSAVNNQVNVLLENLFGTEKTRSAHVSRDLMKAAADYFQEVKGFAMGEQKYGDSGTSRGQIARDIKDRQKILHGPFEWYRKGTNWAMNNTIFGDEAFNRHAFSRMLAGYLKAKGVTAEQFSSKEWRDSHAEFVANATQFAAQRAQENTFRDSNALSDWISKVGRRPDTPKAIKIASEGLQPFRKTPANVFVRAEEYSPLGIINTAVKAVQKRRGADISGAEIAEQLSKTFTGTGLFLVGMLLKNAGWLRGADDDDEKQAQFDDLQGHQEYSIELPDGTSITMDWLTPASMPIFMGAELMKSIQEYGISIKTLEDALTSLPEPMIEMSMMQGINDTLDKLKNADGDNVGQLALSAAAGYLTQGLTNSLAGQVARSMSDESMMTFTDNQSDMPVWMQREVGKISRKLPGSDGILGVEQVPYVDAWGRTESSGDVVTRLANNMFNPAFVSKVQTGEIESELQRLYDSGVDKNVFPTRAEKEIPGKVKEVNGEEVAGDPIHMTAEQYTKYAQDLGKTKRENVGKLIKSGWYKNLDDEGKAEAVDLIYRYSTQLAVEKAGGKVASPWVHNAKNAQKELGVSTIEWLGLRTKYGDDAFSGPVYEKMKSSKSLGMSVDDFFRFRKEAPVLLTGPNENGVARASKSEAELWLRQNGYPTKTGLMKVINSKY